MRRLAVAIACTALLFILGVFIVSRTALPPARAPLGSELPADGVQLAGRSPGERAQTDISTAAPITLAAVFAPWYGYDPLTGNCQGGLGSFHWNNDPNMPMTLTLPLSPTYPISYTIKNWTGRPKEAATVEEGWQWFFGPPQDPIDGLSDDGVAFVYPRFDETPAKLMGASYVTWKPRSLDPLLTQGAYERQWQRLATQRSRVKMVVVYGWNLYGEQAYIEPASATLPRPSIGHGYVERTREYFRALIEGHALTLASHCVHMQLDVN